jgi:repressor LexA
MHGLTARQQLVLDFVRASIAQHGYAPSIREICDHIGIRSTNGVNDHLRALERKGYLVRQDMKSRAMRLVENGTCSHCGQALPVVTGKAS